MHNVTLQINLSPGDIRYARTIVPALVKAHRETVDETLAIVDCCPPQAGEFVKSERRISEEQFKRAVEQICTIAAELQQQGWLDRIVYLYPNDPLLKTLSHKYLDNWVQETHDYSGCGLMSYLAAFEVINTRYLLHYDGDMLLYQAPGYDWSIEARYWMESAPDIVAASPRLSPPSLDNLNQGIDAPSLDEDMHTTHPLKKVSGGWCDDWFSARCYLMDREKLWRYLPLLRGFFLVKMLAAKSLRRGYPRTLEMMFCKRIGPAGGCRLVLESEKAWLLHPATKPERLVQLLPQIQDHVQQGQVPTDQEGFVDIQLSAWEAYLSREIDQASGVAL
jgi:hypothetical protein